MSLCVAPGCTTTSEHTESRGDAVQAYLRHGAAVKRCDAFHPGEGHGERCGPPYEMGRFVDLLVHKNDSALLEILHSPKIPKKDKMNILQYLNEVIEKEYPGTP